MSSFSVEIADLMSDVFNSIGKYKDTIIKIVDKQRTDIVGRMVLILYGP